MFWEILIEFVTVPPLPWVSLVEGGGGGGGGGYRSAPDSCHEDTETEDELHIEFWLLGKWLIIWYRDGARVSVIYTRAAHDILMSQVPPRQKPCM